MKCSECERKKECKKKYPYKATPSKEGGYAGDSFNRKELVKCGK